MRTRFAFAILFASWFSACGSSSKDNTTIVVAVWSDLAIPSELDSIRIDVKGNKEGSQTFTLASPQPGDTGPLLKAELVPGANKNLKFLVTATGVRKGVALVSQSAQVSFVPGQARLLKLVLASACKTQTCLANYTCEAGSCNRPIAIPNLPPYNPNEKLTAPDASVVDSGMEDANGSTDGVDALDSRARDAVVVDMGMDVGAEAPIVVEGTGGCLEPAARWERAARWKQEASWERAAWWKQEASWRRGALPAVAESA